MTRASVLAASGLVLLPLLWGCRGGDERRAPSAAPSATAAPPPDQLQPGELAAGKSKAFGLELPRVMAISAQFPDAIFAKGSPRADDVVGYVRARVVAEREDKSATKTVFQNATLKTSPGRVLSIEVVTRSDHTELVVRDVTRPPAKDGLTEEQRWRELGLTPQGQPLDPTKLE